MHVYKAVCIGFGDVRLAQVPSSRKLQPSPNMPDLYLALILLSCHSLLFVSYLVSYSSFKTLLRCLWSAFPTLALPALNLPRCPGGLGDLPSGAQGRDLVCAG